MNGAVECGRIERDTMDDGSVLKKQRHQIGARQAASKASPRIQLGLDQSLRAPASGLVACDGEEQGCHPHAGRPQLRQVEARHQ